MLDIDLAFDLAAILTGLSHETPDGHRVWDGDRKGYTSYQGTKYTYRQAAYLIRTGAPARGRVYTACNVARCLAHVIDLGTIPAPATTTNPHWRQQADCRDHDAALWFPEDHPDKTAAAAAEALLICQTCPVRAHCLDDALTTEGGIRPANRFGIRGGLTASQRHNEYTRRLTATDADARLRRTGTTKKVTA